MEQTTVPEIIDRKAVAVPLRAKLKRTRDGSFVHIEADDRIEDLFRTERTEQSNYWCSNGDYHEFYRRTYDNDLAQFMDQYYDSYGDTYVSDGDINVALLRTKGISDGKKFYINNHYSEETLIESLKQLKQISKQLYQQFIRPVHVTTRLTVTEL